MHSQNFGYYAKTNNEGELDNIELLKTVASLRRDFLSMSTDIREVLKENEKLQREVDRLKEHQRESVGGSRGLSEVHRVKSEVDELIRLHEMASRGKARAERRPVREQQPVDREQGSHSEWFKKMMMVMMMAEMV